MRFDLTRSTYAPGVRPLMSMPVWPSTSATICEPSVALNKASFMPSASEMLLTDIVCSEPLGQSNL